MLGEWTSASARSSRRRIPPEYVPIFRSPRAREPNPLEQRHAALLRLLLREAVQPGLEVEVLPAGEERIERRFLECDSDDPPDLVALRRDVEAADGRAAPARRQQGDEHLDHGRLAGPVRAEEAVDLPGLHVQVDAVDRAGAFLVLADETFDFDRMFSHPSPYPFVPRRKSQAIAAGAPMCETRRAP